ncbi:hypothetical protein EI265_10475 [Salmonella enterica]|uniref:Uncharacterized protein n=2 Tax=Salmonella enterica TaxID=28901 RepID=A0A5U5ING0_SALER|nr:hypothetical protein [Salmonella enterica subsp. enterica serovar Cubana]EAA7405112.1 hypothetical protein [Salmonella enterica subsp. enterica]EAA7868028.1 hypothetical protein [Salmonella enterica]EBD0146565.1 hypothetical protein [Salmonella enterica subsp. enterica serovar Coeln]EBF2797787.1 hypothetical protein [Salmonella enterica subsp. enterica serovar Altona]ECI2868759.1 hypothetical protein [Salmonella enterica subsp. enterica serovar Senftenberg]EDL6452062.1 hypothetical protein
MVSANASTRLTFGRSFRAFRSSLDISSSRYTLPDGASLAVGRIRHLCRHPAIQVIPRNHAQDRAPGE